MTIYDTVVIGENWEVGVELLTIQETARVLKVAPLTVRRYIRAGRLPAVKVGRGVRVRKEMLEQLLTSMPIAGVEAQHRGGMLFTAEDALWDVVGIGASEESTDIASRKDEYLAEVHESLER